MWYGMVFLNLHCAVEWVGVPTFFFANNWRVEKKVLVM
jgi:hypothetical protein